MNGSWKARLLVEEAPTEDGRMLAEGSISWRELPLSLMALIETGPGGHEGAEVAGRMDTITRDGNEIWSTGVFSAEEFGQEVERLVADQMLRGVSVDLAILEYEIRDAVTGQVLDADQQIEYWMDDKPTLFVVLDAIIGAATVCPFQAIADATIEITAGAIVEERMYLGPMSNLGSIPTMKLWAPFALSGLTASAANLAPVHPPVDWFADPKLTGPCPLTVTDDGRVYGHLGIWGTCHLGNPQGPDVCTELPHSDLNYALFHLGETVCDDGTRIPTGTLTLDSDHARKGGIDPRQVKAHYDNTGSAVVDCRVGEDSFGVWFAGALRPDVPVERLRALRASRVSGDWRRIEGNLELVAALCVNVGGFAVPRPEALVASGIDGEPVVVALTAAGMFDHPPVWKHDESADIEAAAALGGAEAVAALVLGD